MAVWYPFRQRFQGNDPTAGPVDPPVARYADWRITFIAFFFALIFSGLLFHVTGSGSIYWGRNRSTTRSAVAILVASIAMLVCLLPQRAAAWPKFSGRRLVLLLALALVACLVTSQWALDGFLNSADENAYLFQAKTFLLGRLSNPVPPLGQALGANYLWVGAGKWAGQYPPGWPAALAIFLQIPGGMWLANAVIIVIIGILIYAVVNCRSNQSSAWSSASLFLLTPFAIFNGGALYSHPLSALLALAATSCFTEAQGRQSNALSLSTGILIGMLALTRSATAIVAGAAIAPFLLYSRRRFTHAALIGCGALPFVLALLWYQFRITGDPMKPAYWLAGRTVDHLYFDSQSIGRALQHEAEGLAELCLWVSPAVPVLWLVALVLLARWRAIRPADLLLPFGLIMFAFYPLHPGMRYGPRYLFDFWPGAVVTIGASFSLLGDRSARMFQSAIVASICLGVATWLFLLPEWRGVTRDREQLYRLAAERSLTNAVVCVRGEAGQKLTMPASDLARNEPDLSGSILYARCDLSSASAVARAFPGRQLWIFRGDGPTAQLFPFARGS